MRKRCAIVVRVSDPRQSDHDNTSLDNQLGQIRRYIEYKDSLDEGEEWQEECIVRLHGVSGKDSFDSTEFSRLVDAIREGKIDVVIATVLDRFGRSVSRFLEFFETLEENNVDLVVTNHQIDTTSPMGKMVIVILMALAEMERTQLSEKITRSIEFRTQKGLKTGGAHTLGFDYDPDRPGIPKANAEEAPAVDFIFTTFLECGSYAETARKANESGFRSKKGNEFCSQSIKNILTNWLYAGYIEVNKKNKGKSDSEVPAGKEYSRTRVTEGFPVLIDPDKFLAVQKLIESNARGMRTTGTRMKRFYLLSGLVRCDLCHEVMAAESGGRPGKKRYYYACKNSKCLSRKLSEDIGGRRKRNSIGAEVLEDGVLRLVAETASDSSRIRKLTEFTNEETVAAAKQLKIELGAHRRRLQGLQEAFQNLLTSREGLDLDEAAKERASQEANRLSKEIESLESIIEESEVRLGSYEEDLISEEEVNYFLDNLTDELAVVPHRQQKEVIRSLFKEIGVGLETIRAEFLPVNMVKILRRCKPNGDLFDWKQGWLPEQDSNLRPSG